MCDDLEGPWCGIDFEFEDRGQDVKVRSNCSKWKSPPRPDGRQHATELPSPFPDIWFPGTRPTPDFFYLVLCSYHGSGNITTTKKAKIEWKYVTPLSARPYMVECCKRTSDVSSRQRLRPANRCQLIVPRHRRSMFGRRAFSVAGPMEWNSLPDSLRDPARSTDSFRSALKTHLFAALRDN